MVLDVFSALRHGSISLFLPAPPDIGRHAGRGFPKTRSGSVGRL
ncbi:hypothetical protein CCC_03016 [Paramagnetospirillum magnetotacticum MS-1]|uniref:Uncharacterized protein n=1 Tax=Paramagnetospirillum magnetotacticum MS-1 TaxID=272627 RepID=A0A0C2UFD8_PARME|nr:hypothetical protein CCC_03016 [Paramagnetospirillum magnetotacticum MS-1]